MDSGTPPAPYPHLDARLQLLTGDALHFWGDVAVREQSIRDILNAYSAGDPLRLESALQHVDEFVTAGLRGLGFNRNVVNAIRVRRLNSLGLKRPTCDLEIDVLQIRRALGTGRGPDGILETWIHESVHGRRSPWGHEFRSEQIRWLGLKKDLLRG